MSISEPPLTTTTFSVVGWRRSASSSVGVKSRVTSTPLTSGGKGRLPKYAGSTPRKTMAAPGNSGSTEFSKRSRAGCRMATVTSICLSAYFSEGNRAGAPCARQS